MSDKIRKIADLQARALGGSTYSEKLDRLFAARYNRLPDELKEVVTTAYGFASEGKFCLQTSPQIPVHQLKQLELLGYEVDDQGVVFWTRQTWFDRLFKRMGSRSPYGAYHTMQYAGLAWQLWQLANGVGFQRKRGAFSEKEMARRLSFLKEVFVRRAVFQANAWAWREFTPKLRELGYVVTEVGPVWCPQTLICLPSERVFHFLGKSSLPPGR